MPAVVTFDVSGPLRIVEISTGGDNELDWLEIYSEWKVFAAQSDNMKYPPAFRVVGGDPTGPASALGSTFFLQPPWKFKPAELSHRLKLNGNTRYEGGLESVIVPTDGNFTVLVETEVSNLTDATFVDAPDVRINAFDGAVLVDPNNVTGLALPGTAHPGGTQRQPCDNFTDALTIASTVGLSTLKVLGGTSGSPISIPSVNLQGKTVVGASESVTFVDVSSGAQVAGTEWYNMDIRGIFDGTAHVERCVTRDLSFVSGVIRSCRLRGDIGLSGTDQFSLIDCVDDLAGLGTPAIDWQSTDIEVIVRNYRGGLHCKNRNNAKGVSIDGVLRLVLESTFAGTGDVLVRGVGPEPVVQNPSPAFTLTAQMVDPDKLNRGRPR